MTNPEQVAQIAVGLDDFEIEFITGWQGPRGAAFNVVATGLVRKGLLRGMDLNLNERGKAVRDYLKGNSNGS